jgi:cobalt-zinc-cadmium efflux system protein
MPAPTNHEHHGDDHDHSHDDGRHHHHHHRGENASEKRLWIALTVLGGFTVVEAIGGWWAHSIALLAEAAHMLADCGSLVLAIVAIADPRVRPGRMGTVAISRLLPIQMASCYWPLRQWLS